jgi:hypothetical protein
VWSLECEVLLAANSLGFLVVDNDFDAGMTRV